MVANNVTGTMLPIHFEMNSHGVGYSSEERFYSGYSLQMHFLLLILFPDNFGNHVARYILSLVSRGMILCVHYVRDIVADMLQFQSQYRYKFSKCFARML